MANYNAAQFDPPAPVAQAKLRDPNNDARIAEVPLLMDTGADITLLPRAAVEWLGVSPLPGQRYELMGFDGSKSSAPAVIIDVILLSRAFRGRYLLVDSEVGILGRDVLNHLALLFDGPRQQWSEYLP